MFGRKARLIKELTAATETNKITIRMQDETIQKYSKLALERAEALDKTKEAFEASEEVSHAKDGRIRELQGHKLQLEETIAKRDASYRELAKEFETKQNELMRALEKIQELEEELRLAKQEASNAARKGSFGSLDEVNDFPGEKKTEGHWDEVYRENPAITKQVYDPPRD